jgi:TonB family protein
MIRRAAFRWALSLLAYFLFFPPAGAPQVQNFIDLGKRLDHELKPVKPHLVAVVDLHSDDGSAAPQGHYLSFLLSSALRAQDKRKFEVADHLAFDADLARLHLTSDALRPGPSLQAASPSIGADFLIIGTFTRNGSSYFLQITPVRTADSKTLDPLSLSFENNEFFENLITPFPQGILSLSGSRQPRPPNLTMPSCIHCPDPSYTDLARVAKINGTVVFNVLVSAEGEAKQMRPVKMLGYGLDEQAFFTIRRWKFKPAATQGNPIPVIVPIEVNFRIY